MTSKIDTKSIIKLNSVGLSLNGIAVRLGCHFTTVATKLRENNIPPADTRRAFMEDFWEELTPKQRKFFMNQLTPGRSGKDYLRDLLIADYLDNDTG